MTQDILMKGQTVQLLPFEPKYWESIAKWAYSPEYKNYFRQFTRMLNEQDFKTFPQLINGEVFMVFDNKSKDIIGMTTSMPCFKKNKATFLGLIIDQKAQKKRIPTEVMLILMDYLFNKQGYNKIIIESLESDESLTKVLNKTGFYKEGKLLQECFLDGKYQNELRYSMSAFYFNKNKDKVLQEYKLWVDSLNQ